MLRPPVAPFPKRSLALQPKNKRSIVSLSLCSFRNFPLHQCFQIFHYQNHTPPWLTFQSLEFVLAGASIRICGLGHRNLFPTDLGFGSPKSGKIRTSSLLSSDKELTLCIFLSRLNLASFPMASPLSALALGLELHRASSGQHTC